MQRRFDFATPEQFPELVELVAALLTRKISEVHLHHTFFPGHAFYHDLAGPRDRSGEAAGREICERIWMSHSEQLGWEDIAQHVTIDPTGRIWNGRDWNLPPASAVGQNGNPTRGPFMVALLGNFEAGAERPTDRQLDAAAAVIAAIQKAFSLSPETLCFHCDLDEHRTCPGTIDRAALVKKVAALHKTAPDQAARGPLGNNQREVYRLVYGRRDENGADRGGRPLGDEAPGCRPGSAPAASLTSRRSGATTARGGGAGSEEVTPEMFRILRNHVIHLRNGQFEESGPFATTRSDAQALVTAIATWAQSLPANAKPRVLIWAHGGLVSLEQALAYSWRTHRWWRDSGIYPVYFVWETGAIETALQIVEGQLGPKARGVEFDDWLVENLVHAVGRPFWRQMKTSAMNAAMAQKDRGAFALAELLAAQLAKQGAPKLELHAVGHSAGAIFHGNFLPAAKAHNLSFASVTFLAPACTTRLFETSVQPLVASGSVARFRMFALDRGREIADPTVPVYDKSLLYLVSRGFEEKRGEPILGLEESIRQDDDLIDLFGLAGGTPKGTLVFCPTPDGAPEALASGAKVHAGFAQDPRTLVAIRADILGDDLPASAPPPPDPPQDRGSERLYRTFRETYPYAFASLPAPSLPVTTAPALASPTIAHSAASGARRALSIAINAYGGGNDLEGCIEDSRLWTGLFGDLGFEVTTLHDEQATRAGIAASIEAMVRSARPGDVLALHYSGHGTKLPDLDGDEDADDTDEALVPIDGVSHGEYLIDDDIRLLFDALHPQVHFTYFADCCHSGTSSRFSIGTKNPPPFRARFIKATPEMIESHTAARRSMRTTRSLPEGGEEEMTHVLFSACKDRQTAKESDGSGWFTRVATQVLREAQEPLTNRELLRRIEARFGELGYLDSDQDPQLEGKSAAKDWQVLGGLVGRSARR